MRRMLSLAVTVWLVVVLSFLAGAFLGRDAGLLPEDATELSLEDASAMASAGELRASLQYRSGYSLLEDGEGSRFFVRLPPGDDAQFFLNHLNRNGVALRAVEPRRLAVRNAVLVSVFGLLPLLATGYLILAPRQQRLWSKLAAG